LKLRLTALHFSPIRKYENSQMPRITIYSLAFLDNDYTPYHILKLMTKNLSE